MLACERTVGPRSRGLDLNGKRVLIVEDDYLTAQGLSHTIADYGFTVVGPVDTADRAVRLIGHEPPDGALLDVRLREGSAVEVAKALQKCGGIIRRYERIFPRYTAPGAEEGAFCCQADERVGVDRYGPKYILAVGLPPLGFHHDRQDDRP